MTKKQAGRAGWFILIAAVIAAVILISNLIEHQDTPSSLKRLDLRVADSEGASVAGAKVLLFYPGGVLSNYSDTNGVVSFNVSSSDSIHIVVETDQYEIYDQHIQVPLNKPIDVRLNPRSGSGAKVIFRVVDGATNMPIGGAKVVLITQGHTFSLSTDSNGLAELMLSFPDGEEIDALIRVSTNAYEVSDQNVALSPNRVQDIRLNPNKNGSGHGSSTATSTSSLPSITASATLPKRVTQRPTLVNPTPIGGVQESPTPANPSDTPTHRPPSPTFTFTPTDTPTATPTQTDTPTPTPSPVPSPNYPVGDLNQDCVVNETDIAIAQAAWNSKLGDPNYDSRIDFDGDNKITVMDLQWVGNNYGKTCP